MLGYAPHAPSALRPGSHGRQPVLLHLVALVQLIVVADDDRRIRTAQPHLPRAPDRKATGSRDPPFAWGHVNQPAPPTAGSAASCELAGCFRHLTPDDCRPAHPGNARCPPEPRRRARCPPPPRSTAVSPPGAATSARTRSASGGSRDKRRRSGPTAHIAQRALTQENGDKTTAAVAGSSADGLEMPERGNPPEAGPPSPPRR